MDGIKRPFFEGDESQSDFDSDEDFQTSMVSMKYCWRLKCNYRIEYREGVILKQNRPLRF